MANTGIFEVFPVLSYDDDVLSDEVDEEPTADEAVLSQTKVSKSIKEHFENLKHKWSKAFWEVEASYLLVTSDIDKPTLECQFHLMDADTKIFWQVVVKILSKFPLRLSQALATV
jgi:hypothetical protein